MPGPVFWGLDGSGMDDDFAFSFHRTLEEWEAEQREYEEFNRKFAARDQERKRLGVEYREEGPGDRNSVWTRSYSDEAPGQSPMLRLFGLGTHLSELIVDLKEPHRGGELPAECRELIDQLSRDFGNLREVAGACAAEPSETFWAPVVERFCETLEAVAAGRPALEAKCGDFQRQLQQFLDRPGGVDDAASAEWDDDLPF